MDKPECPRCRSTSLRARLRTQECVCSKCGQRVPNPWDRPDEYKALFESMNPPIEIIIKSYETGEEIQRITVSSEKDTNHD